MDLIICHHYFMSITFDQEGIFCGLTPCRGLPSAYVIQNRHVHVGFGTADLPEFTRVFYVRSS
jgi:hypothetical protein